MSRVGFIVRRFLPARGGVETFVYDLADYLKKTLDLQIVTQIASNSSDFPGVDDVFARTFGDYRYENFKVRTLTPTPWERVKLSPCIPKLLPGLRRHFYAPLKVLAVRQFARVFQRRFSQMQKGVALIHAFSFDGLGLLSQRTAAALNIPFVITPFVHRGQWGDSRHDVETYNKANAVIALHEADANVLEEIGVSKNLIRICGIGILPYSGEGKRFRAKYKIEGPLVLFAGRMVNHKGYRELVKAVTALIAEGVSITLVLLGPPTEASRHFFRKIQNPKIIVLGQVSDDEKHNAFFACDLFCLPSSSEIFPVTILEAWFAGKPVLVGDNANHRALVESGKTGKLVPQKTESIKKRLSDFADNPAPWREMGKKGRAKVTAEFLIEKVGGKIFECYKEVGAAV